MSDVVDVIVEVATVLEVEQPTTVLEVLGTDVTVIEVEQEATPLIEVLAPVAELVEVIIEGPQGPPGEAGAAAQHYRHIQSLPATVWVIDNPFPFRPNVTVTDSAGTVVVTDVTYPTSGFTPILAIASAAFSGYAELS